MDEKQLERIAELRRSGCPYKMIGRVVGLSQTAVYTAVTKLVQAGRLVQPDQIAYSDGRRGPAHWHPRGRIALPDLCPDCGERRIDGRISHQFGCSRAWL